jgi:hypothetical protein
MSKETIYIHDRSDLSDSFAGVHTYEAKQGDISARGGSEEEAFENLQDKIAEAEEE